MEQLLHEFIQTFLQRAYALCRALQLEILTGEQFLTK